MNKNKKFGLIATDKITGFTGVVTGSCQYITGCDQYLLQPPCKDGAFVDAKWFDDGRLIFSDEVAVLASDVTGTDAGADIPAPVK